MKVFIIVATTADGFIAKNENHLADWTSKSDKKFFQEITKKAGTVVMGSKTFETINRPLKDRRNIILSRTKKFEGVETSSETPKELIKRLGNEGVNEIAICGGSSIYTAFIEENLVDEIYITIEPLTFGKGMPIFNKEIECKMELEDTLLIGEGSVVLKYKVKK